MQSLQNKILSKVEDGLKVTVLLIGPAENLLCLTLCAIFVHVL